MKRGTSMAIKGKLATILSNYEVAFNVGSNEGVQEDDIATVFREVDVNDPDTGENLGKVLVPRIRFKIRLTQNRMSVGRSYESVVKPSQEEDNEIPTVRFWVFTSRGTTKKVTDNVLEEDWATVYISPGDPVQIEHRKPPEPEPTQTSEEQLEE